MTYADPIDEATAREMQLIEIALANRTHPEPRSPICKNCGEPSLPATSYCSSECREDDERIERAKQHRRVA